MGAGYIKNASTKKALTLIELLVSISITTIVAGVIVTALKAGFDTYSFSQSEIMLERAVDEALDSVTGADFDNYGVKDAVEILSVSPDSITFVPIWIQGIDVTSDRTVTLEPPLKAGSALPIAEVVRNKKRQTVPVTFIPGEKKDKIVFSETVSPGDKAKIIYYPDASAFPSAAMTIKLEGGKLVRMHKGRIRPVLRQDIPGVTFSKFRLKYFDSTNNEILSHDTDLANITAIEIAITAEDKKGASKTGFTFVNLRNTRTSGAGIIIKKGMRINIPSSQEVRMFSITNITDAKAGGTIELKAIPAKGDAWKVIVALGYSGGVSSIRGYTIEYPEGNPVHTETLNISGDVPLNFMNLGTDVSYGAAHARYSMDEANTINVSGDVKLVVERMDAKGAMLFVRP